MADEPQTTSPVGPTVGRDEPKPDDSKPLITDKRSSRKEILNAPTDYSKNPNRLSNVRWPLGEEPYADTPGTDGSIGVREIDPANVPDDEWVNVKLEVVENPDPGPNQRDLIRGGPEIRMKCFKCGKVFHLGAEKTAREVLEEGGFKLADDVKNADAKVIAAVCENGHVLQLREDMALRLVVK